MLKILIFKIIGKINILELLLKGKFIIKKIKLILHQNFTNELVSNDFNGIKVRNIIDWLLDGKIR